MQHWKEGGHDQLCRPIKKAGGAEQYHATKKYTESVAVAAEACAEDTKGQTCYICTQALHWKTKEGLVRMCSCRGTAGFAHVSCLAEQAKILVAEAEENNKDSQWHRWSDCSLCEQRYHGVVACALGWACWKTYLGRAEKDWVRESAMTQLGNGLYFARHYEDALVVQEAHLAMLRRVGSSEEYILIVQGNIANSYYKLRRLEPAQRMYRDVYSGHLTFYGEEAEGTIIAANNYALNLKDLHRFEEVKALVRKTMPVARRVLGEIDEITLRLRSTYAQSLYKNPAATLDDLREAVATLGEIARTARRVLGGAHPLAVNIETCLREARAALAAREGDDVSALCDGVDAMTTRGASDRPCAYSCFWEFHARRRASEASARGRVKTHGAPRET